MDFGMRRYFEHITPKDKFHFLQPWRIPDPATRRDLLGRAGFDALLYLPLYIALAVFLAVVPEFSAVLTGVTAMSVLVVIFVQRYWRMRRQYRPGQSQDGSRGLGRVHTKRSASKMSANEMNPRKITSSFSKREKMRRNPFNRRNSLSISLRLLYISRSYSHG